MWLLQLALLLTVLALVVVFERPYEPYDRPFTDDHDRAKLTTDLMERPCEVCRAGHCEDCVGPPCIHWPCFADDKNADPFDFELS
jgi:hypothetical protein